MSDIDFSVGSNMMTCECSSSPYVYGPAGHVITGNLRIIGNKHIRRLLIKGPSYREQNYVNWNKVQDLLLDAIRRYKIKWAKKEHFDVRLLGEWHSEVTERVKERISVQKRKRLYRKEQVLKQRACLDFLRDFHKHYVLVPADKASNNIIVVCKKYYVEVVLNEFSDVGQSTTYITCDHSPNHIVRTHISDMKRWNINIPLDMEELPSVYWLPKLHKNPYGNRFIAASNKCTTKPLSRLLTDCLTTVLVHYNEYCNGIFRNTGVNCCWVISNSQSVLDSIQRLSNAADAHSLNTYDFSTLYTNIPHDSLKNNMKELIDEAFSVRGAQYISCNSRGKCCWSNERKYDINIDKSQLIDMINYLVDNIYVSVGNTIFRQRIGIPMGTDCAPLLANLYLFRLEYKFMKKLLKTNMSKARLFSNTFRYIDDLLTLNNPSFGNVIGDIYPPELVLKETTEKSGLVSYLDVGISVRNGQYNTTVYDKRDSFNFKIVNFPFMSSNIPSGPAYGIYISQLVRIGRICSTYEEFIKRNRLITTRLIRQGFLYVKLVKSFKKFYVKYTNLMSKYNVCLKRHISDGVCGLYVGLPTMYKHVTVRRQHK